MASQENPRSTLLWVNEARQNKKGKEYKGETLEALLREQGVPSLEESRGATALKAQAPPQSSPQVFSEKWRKETRRSSTDAATKDYYTNTRSGSVWSQIGGGTFVEFYRRSDATANEEDAVPRKRRAPKKKLSRFDKRACGLCGYSFPAATFKESGHKATRQAIHTLRMLWLDEGRPGSGDKTAAELQRAHDAKYKLSRKYDGVPLCSFCNQFFPVYSNGVREQAGAKKPKRPRAPKSTKPITFVMVSAPRRPPNSVPMPKRTFVPKRTPTPRSTPSCPPPSLPDAPDVISGILRRPRSSANARSPRRPAQGPSRRSRMARKSLRESLRTDSLPTPKREEADSASHNNIKEASSSFLVSPIVRVSTRLSEYPHLPKRMNVDIFLRDKKRAHSNTR